MKMKILVLGSNLGYNLDYYAFLNLQKLGHEVKFYGYRDKLPKKISNFVKLTATRSKLAREIEYTLFLKKINKEIIYLTKSFEPDLVFVLKGEAIKKETINAIKNQGIKTVLWYPDDPRFFNTYVKYLAPNYDYVFASSQKALKNYKSIGVKKASYLTFACEPTIHKKLKINPKKEVTFIGSYMPSRIRLFKSLKKAPFNFEIYGPNWHLASIKSNPAVYGPEMVKVVNNSKINLNIHATRGYGPNMRLFEVTGSGGFLITDDTENIGKFFKADKDIVIYKDAKELIELIEYYLDNKRKAREIADSGYKKCQKQHTYLNRMMEMLKKVK